MIFIVSPGRAWADGRGRHVTTVREDSGGRLVALSGATGVGIVGLAVVGLAVVGLAVVGVLGGRGCPVAPGERCGDGDAVTAT
ncbi:hypothetical protein [Streptomyces lushanensis]|uniref:hypothetical protein n=1 Tax=Streptomyces lushanensis TaxID=1434255 RepID=UPI00114C8B09|nr:hypothetical protein [Streptomyces lushanensis]